MATTQTRAGSSYTSGSAFSGLRKIGGSFLGSGLIALISVAALMALWEWLAVIFEVPTWLFPKPSDFLGRLVTDRAIIGMHAVATATTLLEGFVIGVVIAVPLALALTSIPALERGLYPIVVFLNIMPKTVIGPVLIIWFGIGPLVAAVIVFLMCFFPILVDSMAGFRAVDKRLFYISRTMGATTWQSFWKFRLPAAMPHIYSGMKIGVVKAAEGVIVAEFIASNKGLGFMIMSASGTMDMPLMFSGLIAAAMVALLFNSVMAIAGTVFMPWAAKQH
ncbi:ABC transporter permease [Agrobacterium tumefaciens]|jgi:NitT/TauT family transport system permease protein|uniref:ABC transporter permease n=1 Tax=Agrobacterium tumefaciens TaxID=358 RepID=A0AA44F594_AGRTU|nr:ABC transporter permease [Agrobacterium tumefaciens]NSL21282.1 ABC transporter permease [Agrobacterium tumefaciens]NTB83854.1 ABC transporter permease [Agrobacterium tumefaciens]NTC20677.1 ABC transporter permease [Agrobacterium tumefaciens]NTC29325.1 ABC transporter permease [Agrobacterium tumefaciens]NTC57821.1 ABC transporter permease [Agrobacterium tumefaciens]